MLPRCATCGYQRLVTDTHVHGAVCLRCGVVPLVGGGGEESHDWGNLLTMTGLLDHHLGLARTAFFCGSVTMLAALAWMGRGWWRQCEQVRSNPG